MCAAEWRYGTTALLRSFVAHAMSLARLVSARSERQGFPDRTRRNLGYAGVLLAFPISSRADYAREVIELNSPGKPTKKARELALRHLGVLYGLDFSLAVFRAFRRLWACDAAARPVLALFVAFARDPLLRCTQTVIASKQPGEAVTRDELEKLLASAHQDRFSPASLESFAKNVRGTRTQAGYLAGHSHKTRAIPVVTPTNVAFALFLGHLEGLSGQRLFTPSWMNLLTGSPPSLAKGAGKLGFAWLDEVEHVLSAKLQTGPVAL